MKLVDNWQAVLKRSATTWFSLASQACLVMAGAVYVFADDLGDWAYIKLVGAFVIAAFVFAAVIPLVRIVRQDSLHAGR